MLNAVLKQFDLDEAGCDIKAFGTGLINSTWLVEKRSTTQQFILQRVNQQIFKSPGDIAFNIRMIAAYMQQNAPEQEFVPAFQTRAGADLVEEGGEYYRMFPFVRGSHTLDVVLEPEQAFEAAKQFGRFTRLLAKLDAGLLKITLPDFHDLGLRFSQFETALKQGDPQRIRESAALAAYLLQQRNILDDFEALKPFLITRVTHHDTKISNVLFDQWGKGICVIDLDTVMPGYFISDVGDMMRTYLSPVSEEEKDFSKISVRPAFYRAIVTGYSSEMGNLLNEHEKKCFGLAGKYMIYMQALRFLTDHLNNDIYYGARYAGHNFVRAGNQAALLDHLIKFEAAAGQSGLIQCF